MIHIIYQWDVPIEAQAAFLSAWEKTTVTIREPTKGARGSFCIARVDKPTELLTIAKWDELDQWLEFKKEARHTSMREMHALATQVSVSACEQKGDFTV